MSHDLTLDELRASGAHQSGHFQLSSGLHSGDYLQCALHLALPRRAHATGRRLAAAIRDFIEIPELIVAPALGGLIIGHETARALDLPFLFTERQDGVMTLRRGFSLTPGQTVVVVEDVITTGRSTREVVTVLEEAGGRVFGVASMVNRTGVANPFDPLPYQALLEVSFPTWPPDECPLCRAGLPITKPGSRPIGV
jgi:orotate phosphoribosyltransferase